MVLLLIIHQSSSTLLGNRVIVSSIHIVRDPRSGIWEVVLTTKVAKFGIGEGEKQVVVVLLLQNFNKHFVICA